MNNYVNLDNFNIEQESKEIIQDINSLIESIKKIRENCELNTQLNTQLNSIKDPQDKNKLSYIIASIDFYIKILESELSKKNNNKNIQFILDEYKKMKTNNELIQNMINSITINITDENIVNLNNLDINELDNLDCKQDENKYYCFIKDLYDRLIQTDANYDLIKYITQVYLKCTKKLLEKNVNQDLEQYFISKKNTICSLPKNNLDNIKQIFSEEDENILD